MERDTFEIIGLLWNYSRFIFGHVNLIDFCLVILYILETTE